MTPRLHVPGAPLAAGATVELPPATVRHVQALRLQPGDAVALFDGGDDREWRGAVVEIGRQRVVVRVDAGVAVERELATAVTLAIGVPANERMDALIEKAGELGAAAVQPLVCARSVVRLAGERAAARRQRWQAIAASASEQCGRARVMAVLPIVPFAAWLASAPRAGDTRRFVLSFASAAVAAEQALVADAEHARHGEHDDRSGGDPPQTPRPASIVVLSGPEGGLAPDEEAAAVAAGFVRVGLGPRVLRADTAPLAWLAWFGVRSAHGC